MFDVGFTEIMLIMVIALIVVGPERLPALARTIGRWVAKARTIVTSVKAEVEREIRVDELKRSIQQQTPVEEFKQLADEMKSVGSSVDAAGREIRSSVDDKSGSSSASSTSSPASASPASSARPASSAGTPAASATASVGKADTESATSDSGSASS